jgi:hypothetical protein
MYGITIIENSFIDSCFIINDHYKKDFHRKR